MPEDLQRDALKRVNTWLDQLEQRAQQLLDAFQADALEPAQAAVIAGKFITLIARLLELRQQFDTATTEEEERFLHGLFGFKQETLLLKVPDSDQ